MVRGVIVVLAAAPHVPRLLGSTVDVVRIARRFPPRLVVRFAVPRRNVPRVLPRLGVLAASPAALRHARSPQARLAFSPAEHGG